MNIVHPGYATNLYWLGKINASDVTVPYWPPLKDLHPCDFQSSVLKDCTPSDEDAASFYNESRRRKIRTIYYAMIAWVTTLSHPTLLTGNLLEDADGLLRPTPSTMG